MAWRGDELQAEAFQVVEGVVERVDLELAAIAGACIDLADGEAAAEPPLRRAVEICRKLGKGRFVRPRAAARSAARAARSWKMSLRMFGLLEVVARIGAVERFVAEREVGDDVAFDGGFQQRPLEPGRIAQMAALDQPVVAEAHPDQHVAAEGLDQRQPFSRCAGFSASVRWALGQALQDLLDQPETLLDLADADPDPRVDIAVVAHRHLEIELVVGRVADRFARIEGAARGAADIAAGAEGARERRREMPVVTVRSWSEAVLS